MESRSSEQNSEEQSVPKGVGDCKRPCSSLKSSKTLAIGHRLDHELNPEEMGYRV